MQRPGGRQADAFMRNTRAPTGRQSRRNHRKRTERHHAAGDSALVSRCRRCAVRLLHTGHGDGDKGAAAAPSGPDRAGNLRRAEKQLLPLHRLRQNYRGGQAGSGAAARGRSGYRQLPQPRKHGYCGRRKSGRARNHRFRSRQVGLGCGRHGQDRRQTEILRRLHRGGHRRGYPAARCICLGAGAARKDQRGGLLRRRTGGRCGAHRDGG